MNLKLLLEQLLAEEVDEVAVSPKQATSEQLALHNADDAAIVLYSPKLIIDRIQRAMQEHSFEKEDMDERVIERLINDTSAVVGVLQIDDSDIDASDCYEVMGSAAERKYGPLVYDLGMVSIYPAFLLSDRNSVSSEAQEVWKYYLNSRKDVEHVLLAGAENIDNFGGIVPEIGTREIYSDMEDYQRLRGAIESLNALIDKPTLMPVKSAITKLNTYRAEKKQIEERYKAWVLKNPLAYKYRISKPIQSKTLKNNHATCVRNITKLLSSIKARDIERGISLAALSYLREKI